MEYGTLQSSMASASLHLGYMHIWLGRCSYSLRLLVLLLLVCACWSCSARLPFCCSLPTQQQIYHRNYGYSREDPLLLQYLLLWSFFCWKCCCCADGDAPCAWQLSSKQLCA